MDNKLQDLLNRDDSYFIHYASNGFYTGSSPAPKISCIIVYNQMNDTSYNFCIKDHLQAHSKEEAERLMFEDFKLLFTKFPDISFIHWNMTANGFGFKAIQARAKELGVELPTIPEENLFDLSSYVAYLAEKKLSIKQILWFNSLLYGDDYLDGKTEAEYFNKGKYEEISNSVELKVMGFSEITNLIEENELKTEPPYQNNDRSEKEKNRELALQLAKARDKMINNIYEQNKKLQQMKNYEAEYVVEEKHSFFFFDFDHPFISLFANWFANR